MATFFTIFFYDFIAILMTNFFCNFVEDFLLQYYAFLFKTFCTGERSEPPARGLAVETKASFIKNG